MQLLKGDTLLAEWTVEQYLLVQKFVDSSNRPLMLTVGTKSQPMALHEFQTALDNAEDELLEELVKREQIPERIQVFQAGMLINILRDKLLRVGLHHDTQVELLVEDREEFDAC
ncbi:hypothetical protein LU11_gp375 [Pseudomonas phage Lu11]|uniref:hypothetical protein n=1 Tax=Pseudomonas phage Lu11 TaxID=1161927 RepID=UPI00025F18D4|nr:hypothetical protein LU11_gp375 [Pseudomonas phage Lu11]AFH14906.1 hypothetical protein Lu11_0368 [Pseudomonas phage Lu11]